MERRIILPRAQPRQPGNHSFETLKELNHSKGPIAPAGRDAVIRRIRRPVVTRMGFTTKDQAAGLQQAHGGWWLGQVRPLMNLIRAETESRERNEEDSGGQALLAVERNRNRDSHHEDDQYGHVTVGIDKSSLDKVVGIDMVDPKWVKESPTENRHTFIPPGVSPPMNEAGEKVCGNHSCDSNRNEGPSQRNWDDDETIEIPSKQRGSHRDGDHVEHSLR